MFAGLISGYRDQHHMLGLLFKKIILSNKSEQAYGTEGGDSCGNSMSRKSFLAGVAGKN